MRLSIYYLLGNCTFICALFLAFSLHLISILLGNGRGARKCGLMLDALLAKLKLLNRIVVQYNSNLFPAIRSLLYDHDIKQFFTSRIYNVCYIAVLFSKPRKSRHFSNSLIMFVYFHVYQFCQLESLYVAGHFYIKGVLQTSIHYYKIINPTLLPVRT